MGLVPLAAAIGSALLLARDAMELASAAIAVGGALSLACLAQLSALVRETRRLGEKQDDMRAQALALARCMKAFNTRLSDAERGAPDRRIDPAGAALPDPPPEPSLPASFGHSPLVRRGSDALWGIEICALEHDPPEPDLALTARIFRALAAVPGTTGQIFIRSDVAPSSTPKALALVRALVAAQAGLGDQFVLGFPQSVVRAVGEADLVAQLARAGVRMALTDIADTRLDGAALRACNFVAIVLPQDGTDPAVRPGTITGDALAIALAAAGVDSVASPVVKVARQVAGAPAPVRPDDREPVVIPWRALPAPQPRRGGVLSPLLDRAS